MKIKKIALILSLVIGTTALLSNVTYAASNGWTKSQGKWYFYENGNKKSGWLQDGGCWYYLNSDGTMATGWKKVNNTWYYLNSDGSMKTGWLNDSGTWYYLNDDGSMATGWKKVNDIWYYLNSDGSMKIGWLNDGGCWYYLNADGSMAHDTTIEGYKINSNGQWLESNKIKDTVEKTYNFSEALNKFSADSASLVLSSQPKTKNCMYSPMSVFMALSVLSEGANNDTKEAILKTINTNGISNLGEECKKLHDKEKFESETGKCNIANSVWLDNKNIKFKDETLENISKEYDAGIFKEDLSSEECAKKISEWILKNTYGMLGENPDDYISDSKTKMKIINAIYFKDKWESPFYVSNTKSDKFKLSDGSTIDTDFMNDTREGIIYNKENEYKISSLPFKGENKIAFILPAEGKSPYDIVNDSNKLNEALKDSAEINKKGEEVSINYKIPKYKFKSHISLDDSMKKLGLEKVYSDNADFSNFTESHELLVSSIIQDSNVVVDESGAEAAAVTIISVETAQCEMPEPDDFILDKPFIFVIMDKDNIPMFIGVVNNPTK